MRALVMTCSNSDVSKGCALCWSGPIPHILDGLFELSRLMHVHNDVTTTQELSAALSTKKRCCARESLSSTLTFMQATS